MKHAVLGISQIPSPIGSGGRRRVGDHSETINVLLVPSNKSAMRIFLFTMNVPLRTTVAMSADPGTDVYGPRPLLHT